MKKPRGRMLKTGLMVLVGVLIGFPLFSLAYSTLVRTSTPHFCAVCHEIRPAFDTWKTSSHASNQRGFVADCMDCHLPAPQDTYNFFYAKTLHGIKDLAAHFLLDTYDPKENRQAAYRSIKNQQCLKCHRNLLYLPHRRGAMLAHRTVLFPRPGYEKRCTDCHRNLVHNARPHYQDVP
jgi:cytochrome c nitrite reductase small subunit